MISYPSPGTYSIGLYVNNDSVCFDSMIVQNLIVIHPQPVSQFSIQAVTDTIVNPSGIYHFIDQSIDAVRWQWNFSDGGTDTIESPLHRFYYNGIHNITLICYNEFGCPDTSNQQLEFDYLGSLIMPNVFAPDAGDEQTAYFIPKGVGLREFLIEIYSPYGELVWYSDKLVNGSPIEKWDGKHNGKPVPQGAYVWKVRAIFENGNVWMWRGYDNKGKLCNTGSVNVLR